MCVVVLRWWLHIRAATHFNDIDEVIHRAVLTKENLCVVHLVLLHGELRIGELRIVDWRIDRRIVLTGASTPIPATRVAQAFHPS